MSNKTISQETVIDAETFDPTTALLRLAQDGRNYAITPAALVAAAVGEAAVPLGTVSVVSATIGSDTTGERGSLLHPFATLEGAEAAALAGDCIVVLPGTYTSGSVIGAKSLNWYCVPGVSVVGLRIVAEDAVTVTVHGNGMTATSTDTQVMVHVDHPDANVTLNDMTMVAEAGCVLFEDGRLLARRCDFSVTASVATITQQSEAVNAVYLDYCTVRCQHGTSNSHTCIRAIGGGNDITLRDCVLVTAVTYAMVCEDENEYQVRIYGVTMANRAAGAGVSIVCGTLDVDTNVT